ncbi:hypothetical protein K435DRAFT_655833 [Dendrothele bispora CBS 962.96]|uniref:Uncharacterized protein n=1 Tax=Dendrothele bispora (strain CBS 962.96) TaxID=1314807 RepID=A0A4S8MGF7_DENBC|nr:hypothetical protein K435DRAFT_655833 [Dendrothele bispora CBS 962.96]
MEPTPYNITLSSQTATINYSPFRDGEPTAGWNVSYPDGITKGTGVGNDTHRTSFSGATMEFTWIGTAVYLYGTGIKGPYKISVDNLDIGAVPGDGLLGSKVGLGYGPHIVKLIALGESEIVFQYAEVTIGVGYPGYVPVEERKLAELMFSDC